MSEKKKFGDFYPAITDELETGGTQQYKIDGVRTLSDESKKTTETLESFTPDVVDYIRRCDTLNQAIEIVDYLLKRQEISQGQAKAIKAQLKSEGLRSFGSKKEAGHYMQHGLE